MSEVVSLPVHYAAYMPVEPQRPRYAEIADHLRRRIDRRRIKPGEKLPSTLELAQEYGCSYMTARRAIGVLASEGRVVARQGLGTFVTDAAPPPTLQEQIDELRRRVEALER